MQELRNNMQMQETGCSPATISRSSRGPEARVGGSTPGRTDLLELGDVHVARVLLGADVGQLLAQALLLRLDARQLLVQRLEPLHNRPALVGAAQPVQLLGIRRHARLRGG